jgi:unsaturated rhamnogalacturonyl hydrolase
MLGLGAFIQRLVTSSPTIIGALLLLCLWAGAAAAAPVQISGATPLQWSQRLADSEMTRLRGKPAKWDYSMGFFALSLLKLDQQALDARYLPFAAQAVGSLVSPQGEIQGYKVEEYQLDALNPGKTLLELWRRTQGERYQIAAKLLYHQLDSQPRTFDGGFWHKERYTNQMWLDGSFMAGPFYAEGASLFGPPSGFNDVARQMHLMDVHTYDSASGLFYHGWDASRSQPWANPVTGTSSNFWGRAIGWYAMALVDALDYFPTNHPARPELIATFNKVCAGMLKYQNAPTGLWYQVVDQGTRPGNYLEATVSTMMVYALAKGIHQGYLPRDYLPAAEKGYRGIIKNLITEDGAGQWSLQHCCSVAGLGGAPSNGHYRDGSFAYYVSEPVVKNDLKGISPFVLDGIELQPLLNPQ